MFENLLFTIFGLLIRWSYDQTSAGPNTILAFLPPISGLSVLTGEKTTIPIWKICSDKIIVRPGYRDTYMMVQYGVMLRRKKVKVMCDLW